MQERALKPAEDSLPDPGSQLLDVEQVAEMLNCSTRHVYRLSDRGRMPRPVKLGGIVRWSKAELKSWLEAGCPDMRDRKRRER